jgi:hypothetical protein
MEEVAAAAHWRTFNGPLEAGIRAVTVLGAAFPESYDLERLTAYDYLLVRTQQLGGPDDLHPQGIIETPATQVRRQVVQRALSLMMTRNLVICTAASRGIRYHAGETAALFLESLRSPYLMALKARAIWLVEYLHDYDDAAFQAVMRRFFDNWVVEFQTVEHSLGAES